VAILQGLTITTQLWNSLPGILLAYSDDVEHRFRRKVNTFQTLSISK